MVVVVVGATDVTVEGRAGVGTVARQQVRRGVPLRRVVGRGHRGLGAEDAANGDDGERDEADDPHQPT